MQDGSYKAVYERLQQIKQSLVNSRPKETKEETKQPEQQPSGIVDDPNDGIVRHNAVIPQFQSPMSMLNKLKQQDSLETAQQEPLVTEAPKGQVVRETVLPDSFYKKQPLNIQDTVAVSESTQQPKQKLAEPKPINTYINPEFMKLPKEVIDYNIQKGVDLPIDQTTIKETPKNLGDQLVPKGYKKVSDNEPISEEEKAYNYALFTKVMSTGMPIDDAKKDLDLRGTPLGRIGGSFAQGMLSVPEGVLGATQFVGDVTKDQLGTDLGLGKFSKEQANNIRGWIEEVAPSRPDLVEQFASGAGSMLVFMPFGMGAMKLSEAIAQVSPKVANWFGVGASTVLESMTEAGQVYRESNDGDAATRTFLANMLLIGLTNKFGIFNDKIKSNLGKALLSAPLEGLQEGGQEIISSGSQGKKINWGDVITSAGIGAILGAGVSGVVPNEEEQIQKLIDKQLKNTTLPISEVKDAGTKQSAEQIPESEVRTRMGEEAPLRQPDKEITEPQKEISTPKTEGEQVKTDNATQLEIMKKAGIPEEDIPNYALSSVADGKILRSYLNEVKAGDISIDEAAERVKKDYAKMKSGEKEAEFIEPETPKKKEEVRGKSFEDEVAREKENIDLAIESAKLDKNKQFEGVSLEQLQKDKAVLESNPTEYFARLGSRMSEEFTRTKNPNAKFLADEYNGLTEEGIKKFGGPNEQVGDIQEVKTETNVSPVSDTKAEKPKKISAKDEFKVGDVIENSEGLKQTIREVKGNSVFFIDENGQDYSGFSRSTLRNLVDGGSWKRVEKQQPRVEKQAELTAKDSGEGSTVDKHDEYKRLIAEGMAPIEAANQAYGLQGKTKQDKLRKEADRLMEESHKILEGIPAGQPIHNRSHRGLLDRAKAKSEKARELYKQADELDKLSQISTKSVTETGEKTPQTKETKEVSKPNLAEEGALKDTNKSAALRMFGEGKKDTDVVTALGLKGKAGMDQVREWRKEYAAENKPKEDIAKLKDELKRKEDNAKHLMGNKKGAWGVTTEADKKRTAEIERLRNKIQNLENQVTPLKPETKSKDIPEVKPGKLTKEELDRLDKYYRKGVSGVTPEEKAEAKYDIKISEIPNPFNKKQPIVESQSGGPITKEDIKPNEPAEKIEKASDYIEDKIEEKVVEPIKEIDSQVKIQIKATPLTEAQKKHNAQLTKQNKLAHEEGKKKFEKAKNELINSLEKLQLDLIDQIDKKDAKGEWLQQDAPSEDSDMFKKFGGYKVFLRNLIRDGEIKDFPEKDEVFTIKDVKDARGYWGQAIGNTLYYKSKITIEIPEDGTFTLSNPSLGSLAMIKWNAEQMSFPRFGMSTGGKVTPPMQKYVEPDIDIEDYTNFEQLETEYKDAKENYESAKNSGNEKLIKIFEPIYKKMQKLYDKGQDFDWEALQARREAEKKYEADFQDALKKKFYIQDLLDDRNLPKDFNIKEDAPVYLKDEIVERHRLLQRFNADKTAKEKSDVLLYEITTEIMDNYDSNIDNFIEDKKKEIETFISTRQDVFTKTGGRRSVSGSRNRARQNNAESDLRKSRKEIEGIEANRTEIEKLLGVEPTKVEQPIADKVEPQPEKAEKGKQQPPVEKQASEPKESLSAKSEEQITSPDFKEWFGDWENEPQFSSKVVDDNGKPLVVYSGHGNTPLYENYDPKKATAGGFYSSEDPQVASNYSLGKFGAKEGFENGSQYRLKGKNGKYNKKLWQIELTLEQKAKLDELAEQKNQYGENDYKIDEMMRWAKESRDYEPLARRILARGKYDLQSIFDYNEWMGYNIAYPKQPTEKSEPYFERQVKNDTEEIMDALGLEWQAYDWNQPGVFPVYLNIRKPLDADQPFPQDLMQALKEKAKYERSNPDSYGMMSTQWTNEYPLKEWINDIEEGNEGWTTQIPKKALPILKQFGYDGIKERGNKGMAGVLPREQRQINWIAFEPTQIKSAIANKGTFDQNNKDMTLSASGKPFAKDKKDSYNISPSEDRPIESDDRIFNILQDFRADATIMQRVDLEYFPDRRIIVATRQYWIVKHKYDPVTNRFRIVKPGEEGYDPKQVKFRGEVSGATSQPTKWKRGKIAIYGRTDMATILEETIHIFQAEVERKNPKLARAIESWESKVREYAAGEGLNLPLGQELFAKSFVTQAGYKIPEDTPAIPDNIFEAAVEMLNESKSGEPVFDKYLKPQKLNTPASKQLSDKPQGFTFDKGKLELLKAEAEKITDTPEFKRWFGNSKVVDENGNPLVVYHGTADQIDAFDKGQIGKNFNDDKEGFYFTNNTSFYEYETRQGEVFEDMTSAGAYAKNAAYVKNRGSRDYTGANIIPAYVSIQNPYIIDSKDSDIGFDGMSSVAWLEAIEGKSRTINIAKDEGHDGIIVIDRSMKFKNGEPEKLIIAFEPTQIKSIYNEGSFNPDNPNIMFSAKGEAYSIRPADGSKSEEKLSLGAKKVLEIVDDNPYFNDTIISFTEFPTEYLTEEEITRRGYVPEYFNDYIIKEGEPEYEAGKTKYRLIQEGGAVDIGKAGSLLLSPRISAESFLEEIVHNIQYRIQEINPRVGGEIENWENSVKALAENLNTPIFTGKELLAKSFAFTFYNYQEKAPDLAKFYQLPENLFNSFKELLNNSNTKQADKIDQLKDFTPRELFNLKGEEPNQIDFGVGLGQVFTGISDKIKEIKDRPKPAKPSPFKERFSERSVSDINDTVDKAEKLPIVLPDETIFQAAQRKLQDKMNRSEQVVNLVDKVSDEEDFRLQSELFIGRATDKIDILEKDLTNDKDGFLKQLSDAKFTIDDLGEYLYAKHAQERNKHIREKVNPDNESGSGITDKEAQDILDKYSKTNIEKFTQDFRSKIIDPMLKLSLDSGFLTDKAYEDLSNYYNDYVPLKGTSKEVPQYRIRGKGYSVATKGIYRAKGRGSIPENPFIQAVMDYEDTIIRAEKNEVGKSLLKFIEENPDIVKTNGKDLWSVRSQRFVPQYDKFGEMQRLNKRYKVEDNEISVWVDGKQKIITINDESLIRGLKNLGTEKGIKFLSAFNNYLRAVVTMASPEFIITNFERDIQTALANIQEERIKGMTRSIVTDVPKAIRGIWKEERDKTGNQWTNYYNEFKSLGGKTGWLETETLGEKTAKFEKKIKDMQKRGHIKPLITETIRFIEDINSAVENGTRLAVYKNLVDKGLSKQRAAQVAKNITLNFNKKGEWGTMMNTLWMFSNVGIQGSARIFKALKHKNVRKAVGVIAALSFLLNWLNRQIDDEEYDKLSEYEKDTNWIMMMPNGYHLKIKLPYGFNVFAVLGNVTGDLVFGKLPFGDATKRVLGSAVDAFNPFGTTGSFNQLLAPTILDPFVQIAENKNYFGQPIKPEQPAYSPKMANSQLYFRSVSPYSLAATDWLNKTTGGYAKTPLTPDEMNRYLFLNEKKEREEKLTETEKETLSKLGKKYKDVTSGIVDVSPELVDHLIEYFGGGTGRFITNSINTTINVTSKDEVKVNQLPFVRTILGAPDKYADNQIVFSMLDESKRTTFTEKERQVFYDSLAKMYETNKLQEEDYKRMLTTFNNGQLQKKEEGNKLSKNPREKERSRSRERSRERTR